MEMAPEGVFTTLRVEHVLFKSQRYRHGVLTAYIQCRRPRYSSVLNHLSRWR